jgi:GDP-4-dehydro-6-deoxy-D-mannose reductase
MPISEECRCNPSGAYALSKYALSLAGLDYARKQGLNVVIARPFNIIGPGIPSSLVVGAILQRVKQALQGSEEVKIDVGNLDTERDFIAVDDVVDAYVRLLSGDNRGEVFNICSGEPRKIRTVVEELLSHSPRPIRLQVSTALLRTNDVVRVYGDWEKANRAIGFKPRSSLSEALHAAWSYEMERDG